MKKRLGRLMVRAIPCLLAGTVSHAQAPDWTFHAQLTYQLQGHGSFDAPYSGQNSFLDRDETRGSFTTTLFLGMRAWEGGEIYGNAEFFAGSGVSQVVGLAGPPNGETYRVDSASFKASMARLFLRQTWELSDAGEAEAVADGPNQVAGQESARRLTLTAGKFSGTDVFDGNTYSHDPRTQFNNWSLWANGAWDYPADTRGYTWGIALEWFHEAWAIRGASFMEPLESNGLEFDHDVRHAHGEVLEAEHDHLLAGRKGALRFLAYENHARMGIYREAIEASPAAPDVIATREPGRVKYGFGVNFEQAITPDFGVFLRSGWNDGRTESWAFTEIERTVSAGVSVSGALWGRPRDGFGAALAWNGANRDHLDYLAAGGYGFMLGDGRLNVSTERLLDAYYLCGLSRYAFVSLEAQHFENLAFNRDRGPVTVYGVRVHLAY
jgi:hypothetical protein